MVDENRSMLQKQAWDYYTVFSAQRLTTVNFYISLSTVIAGALFVLLQNGQVSRVGAFPGLLLVFLSYVFWKWDRRTNDMVKIAEDALKYFEGLADFNSEKEEPHVVKIFSREEYLTDQKIKKRSIFFWKNYYTYRICLNLIFVSFALVGIAGIVLALAL